MRRLVLPLALFALPVVLGGCALLGAGPVGNPNVQPPAKPVDLDRYLGLWHEQARYEAPFQRGCEAVTAEYGRRTDGLISVTNRCRQGSLTGREKVSRGRARIVPNSQNAKLKVSFFGPFWGDYWVLDRADDYSWAIVSAPSGRYLWLLTRKAALSDAEYGALVDRTRALGFDTELLRRTQQPR